MGTPAKPGKFQLQCRIMAMRSNHICLLVFTSWCTISGSVQKTVQCTVFSDRSPRGKCKSHRGAEQAVPTVKSRNNAYNFASSLTAHCRGGALRHPKNLAGSQGLSGRAMLAPTIESQKSDLFLRKPCPLLVGACIAGPPTVRGQILGSAATANAGRASPPLL